MTKNLFDIPAQTPSQEELFELLLERGTLAEAGGFRLERILSFGHPTPPGEWYDQAWSEWVILLKGEAELGYGDGRRVELKAGEPLLLPPHTRHRVERVSEDAIWLALHFSAAPIARHL